MAILHRKEEKIQVVLGRLPKNYTDDEFVEMFIKLYSKDWGKIKSAYIKKNQDKEVGTEVSMPKPDLYLKQVLATYLATRVEAPAVAEIPASETAVESPAKKTKAAPKKKAVETVAEKETVAKEVKKKAVTKKEEVVAAEAEPAPVKVKKTRVTK